MAENQSCATCGAAVTLAEDGLSVCPACGASQPTGHLKPTSLLPMLQVLEPPDGAVDGDPISRSSGAHPSQTDNTLFNLGDASRAAVLAAEKIESDRGDTLASGAKARGVLEVLGWPLIARSVMVAGGLVLMLLFVLDSSLLGALGGAQLVLSVYYLVGGLVLAAGALLPMPGRLRAAFATAVGAVPLFVAGPLVGGVGGWRGLAASLVILVLPGALLLRARVTGSRLARLLVGATVLLALLIYLVPDDGVVPLRLAFGLFGSGSLSGIVTGLFFLLPLALAIATLTAFAGQGSSGFGNLWACLVLLNASGAVVIAGQLRDELSLVHLGVGLLAAGSAAAVGVADLLDLDAQPA